MAGFQLLRGPLFFSRGCGQLALNYVTQDVSMASLYVSSKMHDTLKKPRDLLMVSYTVRFPELAAKAKHGGEVDIDPAVRMLFQFATYSRKTHAPRIDPGS